jgi:archaellum biogenesis protein FlaJ (TadC family)
MAQNDPRDGNGGALSVVQGGERRYPTPRRLNSLKSIRRELADVYRLARRGEMELSDACKFGYLLSTLGKLSEAELLEDRLVRLEQTVNEGDSHE